MTDREAGRALGIGPGIRYAAPTGTVAIRWDGARAATIWTVAADEIEPADACRELARRYLHVFGPTTASGFARWAGISRRARGRSLRRARGIAAAGAVADRRRVAARGGRARDAGRRWRRVHGRAPAAERRCVLPPRPCRAGAPRAVRRPAAAALDAARLAGRAARRRRDRRNLEARAAHRPDRRLVAPLDRPAGPRSRPRHGRCRCRASSARSRWSGAASREARARLCLRSLVRRP